MQAVSYRQYKEMAGYECPPLIMPRGFEYLVAYFWQLRDFCPTGPDQTDTPITPRLLLDFQEFEGVKLSAFELNVITLLDKTYRAKMADQKAKVQDMEANK